jgi:hypothetical protein
VERTAKSCIGGDSTDWRSAKHADQRRTIVGDIRSLATRRFTSTPRRLWQWAKRPSPTDNTFAGRRIRVATSTESHREDQVTRRLCVTRWSGLMDDERPQKSALAVFSKMNYY